MNFRERFKRKRKTNTEVEEFDITSLLDILVILLVFLLTRYDENDFKINLADNLKLPAAFQRAFIRRGEVVQVNENRTIYHNGKKIGSLFSDDGLRKLGDRLKKRKDKVDARRAKKNLEKATMINLVFDKSLPYESIDSVLGVAAESGFVDYKLIVEENK